MFHKTNILETYKFKLFRKLKKNSIYRLFNKENHHISHLQKNAHYLVSEKICCNKFEVYIPTLRLHTLFYARAFVNVSCVFL